MLWRRGLSRWHRPCTQWLNYYLFLWPCQYGTSSMCVDHRSSQRLCTSRKLTMHLPACSVQARIICGWKAQKYRHRYVKSWSTRTRETYRTSRDALDELGQIDTGDASRSETEAQRRTRKIWSLPPIFYCSFSSWFHRIIFPLWHDNDDISYKKLNATDKRTVTFGPMECSADAYAAEVTQSDSSIEAHMHGNSVLILETRVDIAKKTNASAIEQSRFPPLDGRCKASVQRDEGPCGVVSFLCKMRYRVRISVNILSNTLLTLASLVNTGAAPNMHNKDFIPPAWRKSSLNHLHLLPWIGKSFPFRSCLFYSHWRRMRIHLVWNSR